MALKKNLTDLANEARRRVPEIDADELTAMLDSPTERRPIIIDVREPDERAKGFIPNSVAVPRGVLERDIEKRAFGGNASNADLERPIVTYCGGGVRAPCWRPIR